MHSPLSQPDIVLGNSNARFSGVTSTMLQVLPYQQQLADIAVLGEHHLPANTTTIKLFELAKISRTNTKPIVFHARRNDEIIQALIAKHLFRANIKIAFTSTAQRFHSKFTCWLMGQCDAIISTCQAAANYLSKEPDILIHHGIDVERYAPVADKNQLKKQLGINADFCVGIFGRVRASKGVDILVEAAIPLLQPRQDVKIVICGECKPEDLPFQQQLQQQINDAGLSKQFLFIGKQPFDKLPEYFSAMNVVAALSRNEGFGLTPLEAMASGTALLTSEAGAWQEIFEHGKHGYRTPTGNVAAARSSLEQLINHPELTAEFGVNGRTHVCERYTVKQEAETLTKFLLALARQ